MKKAIIVLVIFLSTVSSADAQIGKFISRAFCYELTHHPTLPPVGYSYEFEAVPADSVSMGVGTAYDTSLSDHEALPDLLTALAVMGALLGLWFFYMSVTTKRKTPKQTATGGRHREFKHDVAFPRNREPRYVYLADHSGMMLL